MHYPTDRIAHTMAFVSPVVEHWLEREIAQWVHPMKDRFDDPSHNERKLLPWSYISLPALGKRRDSASNPVPTSPLADDLATVPLSLVHTHVSHKPRSYVTFWNNVFLFTFFCADGGGGNVLAFFSLRQFSNIHVTTAYVI